jgi:hypothetical protein
MKYINRQKLKYCFYKLLKKKKLGLFKSLVGETFFFSRFYMPNRINMIILYVYGQKLGASSNLLEIVYNSISYAIFL